MGVSQSAGTRCARYAMGIHSTDTCPMCERPASLRKAYILLYLCRIQGVTDGLASREVLDRQRCQYMFFCKLYTHPQPIVE